MDPQITPEKYMENILKLYQKEEYIRTKEGFNNPTMHVLNTSKIIRPTEHMIT
jgi:hypothetical protein